MNPWLQQHAVELLIASLLGLIAWNLRRFIATQDNHGTRISKLETNMVTREHFDELRASLTATATNNQNRTEERLDRMWEHMAGGK